MKMEFSRGPTESKFTMQFAPDCHPIEIVVDDHGVRIGGLRMTDMEFENLMDQVTAEVRFRRDAFIPG